MREPNAPMTKADIDRGLMAWVDQDLCTGDGLCTEIVPEVFEIQGDGLAYVIGEDGNVIGEGGAEALRNIPKGQEALAMEAADECPGECIFITDADGVAVNHEEVFAITH